MYNLIEYSHNYSKAFESLCQVCRDVLKDPITNSVLFKFKSRFLNNTNNVGTLNKEITLPSKHLNNFWIILEMLLINCKLNLILT